MKQVYEVTVTDISTEWTLNGKYHREDGPAIAINNSSKLWHLNGVYYTEAQFNKKMAPVKEMTIAEIEKLLGFTVKIVK